MVISKICELCGPLIHDAQILEANQIWQKQGESTAFAKYGSSHGALHAPFLSQQELRSTAAQPPASPWPQENCSSLCSVKSSQCRSVLSAPPRFSSQGSTSQTRSLPPCEAWKQASTLSTPRPPCRVWPGHQYQQFSGSGSLQSSSSSSVVAPRQPDRKGSDREQKI